MSEALYRSYTAQVDDVSAKERTLVARINTAAVDHYQTVIDPAGIDLAAFRENPVVLWEHGMGPDARDCPDRQEPLGQAKYRPQWPGASRKTPLQ